MASPPCVILTRRASWNCSTLDAKGEPTNEVQNQKFRTWRKRSALDIVYYRLWSARQNSVWYGEKTFEWLDRPIEGANGITKATKGMSRRRPEEAQRFDSRTVRKCH